MTNKDYILGILRSCQFLSNKFDQPTMAANIIKHELIEPGFCSLGYAKNLSKKESIQLAKVWKESCLKKPHQD